MACTSASSIQVAPTFGKQARLGTDPWSFAAPSANGVPFLLDMATLPGFFRVVAFFALAVVMGAAAWTYQRIEAGRRLAS